VLDAAIFRGMEDLAICLVKHGAHIRRDGCAVRAVCSALKAGMYDLVRTMAECDGYQIAAEEPAAPPLELCMQYGDGSSVLQVATSKGVEALHALLNVPSLAPEEAVSRAAVLRELVSQDSTLSMRLGPVLGLAEALLQRPSDSSDVLPSRFVPERLTRAFEKGDLVRCTEDVRKIQRLASDVGGVSAYLGLSRVG
jgi:hypothetical protein